MDDGSLIVIGALAAGVLFWLFFLSGSTPIVRITEEPQATPQGTDDAWRAYYRQEMDIAQQLAAYARTLPADERMLIEERISAHVDAARDVRGTHA